MINTTKVQIKHFHLFCGLGGGAMGFNQGQARVGNLEAEFRCIGGVDIDPAAIRDFTRLSGVNGTVLDLFDREQYKAFHGVEPGPDWREATPDDIRKAALRENPNIVFLSAPCKGFSGLLSESKSKTDKYQALNRLTLRGVWLMLEAWADDPPELVLFENVPRLVTRGRALLDRITAMLQAYGYATAETTHDCGEIGGLAQSRKRFLLVARHVEKVPPLLYEPEHKPLRAVGDILARMLPPGDLRAGPMHRVPALQWKTWVRLAFVEAGSDWRSLNRLAVENGNLRDYLVVPAGQQYQGQGIYSIADPRPKAGQLFGKYAVVRWDHASGTVISGSTTGQGAFAVADPRSGMEVDRAAYLTGGHYGVLPWNSAAGAVSAAACHDNGRWSVADPRLPDVSDNLVAVIRAEDNTWHRPFTTLELAALQGLVDPEQHLIDADYKAWCLDGGNDQAHRERIGNAVPPSAAKAIADVMGQTLLLAWSGETFQLSCSPIWVSPVRDLAVAVAVSLRA